MKEKSVSHDFYCFDYMSFQLKAVGDHWMGWIEYFLWKILDAKRMRLETWNEKVIDPEMEAEIESDRTPDWYKFYIIMCCDSEDCISD